MSFDFVVKKYLPIIYIKANENAYYFTWSYFMTYTRFQVTQVNLLDIVQSDKYLLKMHLELARVNLDKLQDYLKPFCAQIMFSCLWVKRFVFHTPNTTHV